MNRFEILLIAGMVAVTFPVRYLPLAIVGRLRITESLRRGLEYVPIAVLTAICTPTIFSPNGEIEIGFENAYLLASIAAVFIAWRFQNLLATIAGGVAVFALWRILLG